MPSKGKVFKNKNLSFFERFFQDDNKTVFEMHYRLLVHWWLRHLNKSTRHMQIISPPLWISDTLRARSAARKLDSAAVHKN